MTKKQRDARIAELVDGNNLSELKDIAEGLEVSGSGTKQEIAERIVEAEAANKSPEAVEEEAPDETEIADSGSVESRLGRLESSVRILTEQFMAHSHNRNGAVQVSELKEQVEGQAQVVDQTQEAGKRQKALARREELIKQGHKPEDPIPDEDDETEDAAEEK